MGGRRPRRHVALDHARLPDDRASPAGCPASRWSTRAPAATERPGTRLRGRPVPAPVPGPDRRRHRHQGQDHDVLAGGGGAGGRSIPPGRPRWQHRPPDRRTALRADPGPSRRRRAVGAPVCRRCRAARPWRSTRTSPRTTSTGTGRSMPTGGQAPTRGAGRSGRSGRHQRRRPCRRRIRARARPTVVYRRAAPTPGGLGVVDGWIVADRRAPPSPVSMPGHPRRRAGSCRRASWPSRARTTSRTRWPRSRSAAFGVEPGHPAAASAFTGVEHRPRARRDDRRRPVHQRLNGNPAGRGRRRAARVRSADRAHRGWPGEGHRPLGARAGRCRARAAAVLIGESGPDLGAEFRAPASSGRSARPTSRRGPSRRRHRPRDTSRDRRRDRDRPAQPGRCQLRHVRGLRGPGSGIQGAVADARRGPRRRRGR